EILHSPLDTIETCGGGSARCMMAEVFLPKA
ncbi:MAG: amidinotransferase, partial [Maribacter sp.]|nr:amidinotransferase [Maribacter sp.]